MAASIVSNVIVKLFTEFCQQQLLPLTPEEVLNIQDEKSAQFLNGLSFI
jgi:hypothetical protein